LQTAYMHGLRMEFEGGYLDTLDYLRKLEALPWAFFWDSVDFKVEKYPKALGSITVYTLSLDANWIGV
ncbi:MAG: MSHA biogenesis protein MshJ, partial [Gammaproteobacteria bacterium]|nr:MSHA biogenesis protein MshJ [Gammaproteobacteria bacterium]